MILFKLAKWMEERKHLNESMKETEGDVSFLQLRKEQVEQQMRKQANEWMDIEPQDMMMPVPIDPSEFAPTQELANS